MIWIDGGKVFIEGKSSSLQTELHRAISKVNDLFTKRYGKKTARKMLLEVVNNALEEKDTSKSEFAKAVKAILDEE